MTVFVMFILYPLFTLFRKSEIGVKDIVLSSPVKSGDIFLGERTKLLFDKIRREIEKED